jgi:hypothetical protein
MISHAITATPDASHRGLRRGVGPAMRGGPRATTGAHTSGHRFLKLADDRGLSPSAVGLATFAPRCLEALASSERQQPSKLSGLIAAHRRFSQLTAR